MEIIDNKIYLNEDMGLKYDERFKYDEQVYEDKKFLVNELEKIMSMKEDDIMITGHDEQIKEMSE